MQPCTSCPIRSPAGSGLWGEMLCAPGILPDLGVLRRPEEGGEAGSQSRHPSSPFPVWPLKGRVRMGVGGDIKRGEPER